MAPNYQAGKDSLAGFKRYFKGEVLDEVYVPLNQLDYSAELSRIAAAAPDAIFVFLPGGMGVNFVKQFRQAGLADKVMFLSAFTVDESTLPAQQDAALGFFGGANWAPNLDNPQNKEFIAAYEKEYNAVPGSYAFQAYDAALLIDSALKATSGKTDNKDALRAALQKADFKSLRGGRSEEHTSELQSHSDLVCRLLLEKKKTQDKGSCALSRRIKRSTDRETTKGRPPRDSVFILGSRSI